MRPFEIGFFSHSIMSLRSIQVVVYFDSLLLYIAELLVHGKDVTQSAVPLT